MVKLILHGAYLGIKKSQLDMNLDNPEDIWIPAMINLDIEQIAYVSQSLNEDAERIEGRCVVSYFSGLTLTINKDYDEIINALQKITDHASTT